MKVVSVLIILGAMLAPPLLAQAPKKKAVASSKAETGPSIEETQAFIKDNLTNWAMTTQDLAESITGGRSNVRGQIMQTRTSVKIEKEFIKIEQVINGNLNDNSTPVESVQDLEWKILVNIDLKKLKMDDFKLNKSKNCINLLSSDRILIEVKRELLSFRFRRSGGSWDFEKGESFQVWKRNYAFSGTLVQHAIAFSSEFDPERLIKAIYHLCSRYGNKISPSPF